MNRPARLPHAGDTERMGDAPTVSGEGDPAEPARPNAARRRLRVFAGRVLLALAAAALALAGAEGAVRILYPEYGIPVFTTRLFTEFDPILGWRKIPNFRGTHVQEEYTIVERFNSKGLRGPEYPYEKPAGEYRILILGDSFAEGYTVEFEDLCSQLLERELNRGTKARVEVINAGTGGYGTDQELLFFRSEGRKYEPDLVIVLYCENDAPMNVTDSYYAMGRGRKPLFQLVDGKLSLKSTPKKTWDRDEEAGKDLARQEHAYKNRFVLWKPETWFLHRLCSHVLARRSGEDAAGDALQSATLLPPGGTTASNNAYRGRQPDWDMTEVLMAQLSRETSEAGAKFLLFNVPRKSDVHNPKPPDYSIEQNLALMSRRHNLAFIPTIDTFRQQAAALEASGKRLYWKKDTHWTAEGHRLTARILAGHLLAHRQEYGL